MFQMYVGGNRNLLFQELKVLARIVKVIKAVTLVLISHGTASPACLCNMTNDYGICSLTHLEIAHPYIAITLDHSTKSAE